MLRAIALVVALAAVSCTSTGSGSTAPSSRETSHITSLSLLEAEDAQTLDPALIDDPTSLAIGSELFEGLTRLDASLKPVPGLADHWDITDGGRTYTFHLGDARYQSGAPLQARDAIAAWTRVLAPASASPLTTFFKPLGALYPGDALNGVDALDSKTLRVRLPAADSEFLTLLSMPPYWLSDPAHPADPNSGSGPYHLDQWDHGRHLRFSANTGYWGAKPQVRQVSIDIVPDAANRLDRFTSGSFDIAHGFTGPQMLAFERDPQRATELHRVALPRTTWLGFNTIAGSGYGPPERTAIAQAIDRARLTDLAQFGSLLAAPATDLIPPALPGHLDRALPTLDPAGARRALDQSGFGGGIDIYMSTNSTVGRVGRELADEIGDATGRTVTLHPIADFFKRASLDQLPLFIDTWSADVPYPADLLDNVIRGGAQFNNLRLDDPRINAALAAGQAATSTSAALSAYQQAEQIAITDIRLIPLYSGVEPYLVRSGVRVPFTGGMIPYSWEDVS